MTLFDEIAYLPAYQDDGFSMTFVKFAVRASMSFPRP